MRVLYVLLAAVPLLVASVAGASAKPLQSTSYAFYTIDGTSAVEVYNAMIRTGPKVNGARAYAATSATTTQDGKLLQGASCQIRDYHLKLDFVINLPRLQNEKLLPSADRSRWRQFSAFLKQHEETHRSIWLGCAADLERQVKAIKASTCGEADKKAADLWDNIRAACSLKHNALDAADQKRLLKNPFVQMVYRRSTVTHAASVD